jgi:hypothetical protein
MELLKQIYHIKNFWINSFYGLKIIIIDFFGLTKEVDEEGDPIENNKKFIDVEQKERRLL